MIVAPGTKLESGHCHPHLCNDILVVARDVPQLVAGQWKLWDLRRYGAVPSGFIFEGGTRCGFCKYVGLGLAGRAVAQAGHPACPGLSWAPSCLRSQRRPALNQPRRRQGLGAIDVHPPTRSQCRATRGAVDRSRGFQAAQLGKKGNRCLSTESMLSGHDYLPGLSPHPGRRQLGRAECEAQQ